MPLTYSAPLAYGELTYSAPLTVSVLVFSAPPAYTSPGSTGTTGTLITVPQGVDYVGEALIRDAIRQTLVDLELFDDVWVGGALDWPKRPQKTKAASVQPAKTHIVQGYDWGPDSPRIYRTELRIGIYVNDQDTETRDALATQFMQVVDKVLSKTSIAGITVPEQTQFYSWLFAGDEHPVTRSVSKPFVPPPYREIQGMLTCDWLKDF